MNSVGREYAEALFELACEVDKKREYSDALELVSNAFCENEDFFRFLTSPNIPTAERIAALEAAFGEYLPKDVLSFLELMCEKGRLQVFFEAKTAYSELFAEAEKIMKVKVRSAVELSEDQKKRLSEKLEKREKATVNIEYVVEESLLGGVVIEMDDKVIDGSLQNRLQQVKEVISR